jgi:membrane protein DedA with SNARE-associated domain
MTERILEHFGYLAVLIGTFAEGETILVLAGFAAHRGYLQLPQVMLAAFLGSFCGDQLWFALGRRWGERLFTWRPSWRESTARAKALLERWPTPLILGFRFVYGIRVVMPFAIGMTSVSRTRYLVLNATGALVWAVSVATGGYLFGEGLEALLGDLRRHEMFFFAGLALAGGAVWATSRLLWRRKLP